VLQWLNANGFPWEWDACVSTATENGEEDVLAWLNENEEPAQ
jgi:hypothetical protein